jgi:flagellar basal body-associated protein FliL
LKGVSLPINALVVIVLALIILIAILALFFGIWPSGSQSIGLEGAKNNACNMLLSFGCNEDTSNIVVNNFDADKDGELDPEIGFDWNDPTNVNNHDNLAALCYNYFAISSDSDCKTQVCNCP